MSTKTVVISCCPQALASQAQLLSQQLQLPFSELPLTSLWEHYEQALILTPAGLTLISQAFPQFTPLLIDFKTGHYHYRRVKGGGKNQAIAKAVGIKRNPYPTLIDATAGLAEDAFVCASLGCQVILIERSIVIFALLQDAIVRATHVPSLQPIVSRMHLHFGEAVDLLSSLPKSEVIYLDPMFPERRKTAQVKKEMQLLQEVVGKDTNSDALLPIALQYAQKRVVVKRPRLAPFLNHQDPHHSLIGESCRFDIYTAPT